MPLHEPTTDILNPVEQQVFASRIMQSALAHRVGLGLDPIHVYRLQTRGLLEGAVPPTLVENIAEILSDVHHSASLYHEIGPMMFIREKASNTIVDVHSLLLHPEHSIRCAALTTLLSAGTASDPWLTFTRGPMIFRLSHKLAKKIKITPRRALPLDSNAFADWSVHPFTAERVQYIILTNTASLYSTVMYGREISSTSQFLDQGLSCIREFMIDDSQEFIYRRFIAPSTEAVNFSKTLNRSITGSMNDLVYHAQMWWSSVMVDRMSHTTARTATQVQLNLNVAPFLPPLSLSALTTIFGQSS